MNTTDPLTARYLELCDTQNIPNIARYAFEWLTLAEDADKNGRPSLAGSCRSRGEFYKKQAGGEYIRLIEMPFSELIQVTTNKYTCSCLSENESPSGKFELCEYCKWQEENETTPPPAAAKG